MYQTIYDQTSLSFQNFVLEKSSLSLFWVIFWKMRLMKNQLGKHLKDAFQAQNYSIREIKLVDLC